MILSVVIVSNGSRPREWLDQAISSVKPMADQVILVDNGSGRLVDDARVSFATNQPLPDAWNAGVGQVKTDYFMMLGDDDYVNPDALLLAKDKLAGSDIDVLVSLVRNFGDNDRVWGRNIEAFDIFKHNHIPYCSPIRYSLWEKLGGFEHGVFFDWNFWMKAKRAGAKFGFFGVPLTHIRVWPGQTSRMMTEEEIKQAYEEASKV